jgi:hypothetical protein
MERFIVGTGRCGSTLLSRMLAEHPALLSMSEFFSTVDRADVFTDHEMTGSEFGELLSRSALLNDLVVSRAPYLDGASHNYRPEVPDYARGHVAVPGTQMFLAQLEPDPVRAFADLQAFVTGLPRQPTGRHYVCVFDWLTRRCGRSCWIERSGASLEYLPYLRRWYPGARFVHIHRDGPTTALAIRSFRHFVLYASFFLDPPSDKEMEQVFAWPIDPATDPIVRRLSRDMPDLAAFGRYWSWQIELAYREFCELAPDQRLDIRYEDLVSAPRVALERLAQFFDLPPDAGWIDRASGLLDPEAVPDRLSSLSSKEREALSEACRPGQVLLGRDNENTFEAAMRTARRLVNQGRST